MDRSHGIGVMSPDTVVRVPADASLLTAARREVRSRLSAGGAGPMVISDLTLAVSELATNVIMHSDADEVVISLGLDDGRWYLDVSGAGGLGTLEPGTPNSTEIGGRGLAVVSAVVDSVEIVERDGERWVRCTRAA